MIRIINLRAELSDSEGQIRARLEKKLGARVNRIKTVRRAVDARRKNDVHYVLTVDAEVSGEERILKKNITGVSAVNDAEYIFPAAKPLAERPVVVGTGPAGLFCALYLSRAGLAPIVIERGADADARAAAVEKFWSGGELDERTNVQFGEGGAGTFSDGKLNTGTRDVRIKAVLEEFVRFGAPEDILVNAKPHIGTDILRSVVKNMRNEIISNGGEVRFLTRLVDIEVSEGHITAAVTEDDTGRSRIKTDNIVLAIGHSARDTLEMLAERGIKMERKPFSVGARIEHRQEFISRAMYGSAADKLPPADYKLAVHLPDGRSLYTFCMCPGGYVVAAASEKGGLVTNGMSYSDRDGENANSAVLVGIAPSDFEGDDPLAGVRFQREIEQRAFRLCGGKAPAQTVGSFLGRCAENKPCDVLPTYRPGVEFTEIDKVLPDFVCKAMREGLLEMDKRIHGFAADDAVLTVPETRSSSPVTLVRDGNMQLSVQGLYCAGEGGGHAGGITSSAVDGIKAAEAVANVKGA